MRLAKGGDRDACSVLFARHGVLIRHFFSLKMPEEDVDDAVATTFERVLAGLGRFEGRSTFRTFVQAIARHVLLDYYRRKNSLAHVVHFATELTAGGEGEDFVVADEGESSEERLSKLETWIALRDAMRRMPEDQQDVLRLYYWEGRTGAEAGEILGIPENTFRSRLRRATSTLRERYVDVAGEA